MVPDVHSLLDLTVYIRRVLALNFQQPVWIAAEIAQAGQSRGHFYLDFIQKNETSDEPVAQAAGVLWQSDYRRLLRTVGKGLDSLLQEGVEVKVCVRVEYHERYGLKLQVTDIDPAYTLGKLSQKRQQTIALLGKEGLLDRNRALPLPPVLQRIAVVSSEGAAGLKDFQQHLALNGYGYQFECRLFNTAVQGKNTETEILEALAVIREQAERFDCVAILRGGGARIDLAAFDLPDLCRGVARMPLPVLTGIGHEVDETVLDLVAHTSLKTPTAVADFILQHNLGFETAVYRLGEQIQLITRYQLNRAGLELERWSSTLPWAVRERLRSAHTRVDQLAARLPVLAGQLIQGHRHRLDQAALVCTALHPDQVLRRGYSLTTKNGKVVTSPSDIVAGDLLETRLKDGVIRSKAE